LEAFQLHDEVIDVTEFAVNRGKSNVSNLIDTPEDPKQLFADGCRGHFTLGQFSKISFDLTDDRFHVISRHRAFSTGENQTGSDLVTVERLPTAISLDDGGQNAFDSLVCRETAITLATQPSATGGVLVTDET
jgi:hypothetical protein